MRVQELNYENIPIIEAKRAGADSKACGQLKRRVIWAEVGKAKYVDSEREAGRVSGRFLMMQKDSMKTSLSDPITHSLYMEDYVAVSAKAYDVGDFPIMIANLDSVDQSLYDDTEWVAKRLPGIDCAEDEYPVDADEGSLQLVELTHRMTPLLHMVRFSALSHIQEIPGLSRVPDSKNGNKTKGDTLRGILCRVGSAQLFRAHSDGRSFLRLRIDYDEM